MRDLPIDEFLHQLAARVPAPGGGAVAALHAAQAAALLAMVARYSVDSGDDGGSEVVERSLVQADALRRDALELADDDAEAFEAVVAAYGMPHETDDEQAARSAAVSSALAEAAEPPAAVIVAATHLVAMAEGLLPVGNRHVVTDIGAAADAARAAATTARLNIEVNAAGLADDEMRTRLTETAAGVDQLVDRADEVVAAVRRQVSG
ncbi:formiminotetrahydrofolate cyclodeaminase [Haloactinopolyspora alba]|uniref:Formiminotetrahydrofolate cyclodeaminase n=1 Tax=Haloactinopolyspora alba TaxID=648780 RepID=A0A2P8E767_9ACTN|nr:cyclodeaminase/cyclohydrolase family protein [Haloactinopolyspora alba]PSL05277.1 formiminotetrahydrofolate cyclodeaminase [Haloactinopolyspora alba]